MGLRVKTNDTNINNSSGIYTTDSFDTTCIPDQATSLNNMAVCYYEQGVFEKAGTNFYRALQAVNLPQSLRSSLCMFCQDEDHMTLDSSTLIPHGISNKPHEEFSSNDLTGSFPSNLDGMELAFPVPVKINQCEVQRHDEHHSVYQIAVILYNLAKTCQRLAKISDANKWYQQALHVSLTINDEFDDSQKEIVVAILHSMGLLEYIQQHYNNAMSFYTKALFYCENKLAENKLLIATIYHAMGMIGCHDPSGDMEEYLKRFNMALRMKVMVLGEWHPDVAYTCCGLGKLYTEMEQYDEAMKAFDKARRIRTSFLGNSHIDVAEVIFCMGQIHDLLGNTDQVLTFCSKVLSIVKEKHDINHQTAIAVLNNVAELYCNNENFDQALDLIKEVLQIQKNIYGDCDPKISMTLNKLGKIHLMKEDQSSAMEFFQQRFSINERHNNSKHSPIVITIIDKAHHHSRNGQFTEARQLYMTALSHMDPYNIVSRRNMASLLADIAFILYQKQDYKQALTVYNEWYNVLSHLDESCLEYLEQAQIITEIGTTLAKVDRNDDYHKHLDLALNAHQLSLRIQRAIGSPEHKDDVVILLHKIGSIYEQRMDFESAKHYYQQTLQVEEEVLGTDHQEIAQTLNYLGTVQLKMGELDEALECLQRSVQIDLDQEDTDYFSMAQTLLSICQIYSEKGKLDKAMEAYTKASRIYKKNGEPIEDIFRYDETMYVLAMKYPQPSPAA